MPSFLVVIKDTEPEEQIDPQDDVAQVIEQHLEISGNPGIVKVEPLERLEVVAAAGACSAVSASAPGGHNPVLGRLGEKFEQALKDTHQEMMDEQPDH